MVDNQKIRKLRENNNLTIVGLAEKLYTSHPFIVKIEQGYSQPSAALLKRMADYFGVTMNELMKDDN